MIDRLSNSRQRCELCQVEIERKVDDPDLVYFSQGNVGSRAKLWARVCQYLKTNEQCNKCLNQDPALHGEITENDYYAEAPELDFDKKKA